MTLRLAIRGYVDGARVFEDRVDVDDEDSGELEALPQKHMKRLEEHSQSWSGRFMIEIEFLDAPEDQRFLRFGTDPSGMVVPVGFKL